MKGRCSLIYRNGDDEQAAEASKHEVQGPGVRESDRF